MIIMESCVWGGPSVGLGARDLCIWSIAKHSGRISGANSRKSSSPLQVSKGLRDSTDAEVISVGPVLCIL